MRKHICFFTLHDPYWLSTRYRVSSYFPFLEKAGFNWDVVYVIPKKLDQIWGGRKNNLSNKLYSFWHSRILRYLKLFKIIFKARKYDIIFIQKVIVPFWLLWLLNRRNKRIIFDVDDLCFYSSFTKLPIKKRIKYWRQKITHPKLLSLCKHVIVGNKNLEQIALVGNKNVTLIPTSVDCNLYSPNMNHEEANSFTIGWVGSGEVNLQHLKLLVNPLEELGKKFSITFKLIGSMGSEKIRNLFKEKNYKFETIDFIEPERLPQEMSSFDVGVMPLVDDEEARAKCGFKSLTYMAMEIPTVASPVGVNKEIIQDGRDGFFAMQQQWVEKIELLIRDSTLRSKIGKNGREKVKAYFSIEKNAERFIKVLESVLQE